MHKISNEPSSSESSALGPPETPWVLLGLDDLQERSTLLAQSEAPLLIVGETGSGKSSLAQWVHTHSPRSKHPMAIRGCGEFHEQSFVATLFGHEKGAYTGANHREEGLLRGCHKGTLILDDIDALSLKSQASLLGVMDTGNVTPLGAPNQVHKVDVRFIATCNKNLLDLVANGEFREDLYYRLALFRLSLPPLSKRKFNMAKVVQHFEAELLETYPALHSGRRISPKALKLISLLNWPGNFRELRGVVFQVVGYADRTTNSDIGLPELYGMLLESEIAAPRLAELAQAIRSNNALLLEVLRASPDNYSLAADIAGISRPTLYKRMEQNNWQRGIDC